MSNACPVAPSGSTPLCAIKKRELYLLPVPVVCAAVAADAGHGIGEINCSMGQSRVDNDSSGCEDLTKKAHVLPKRQPRLGQIHSRCR